MMNEDGCRPDEKDECSAMRQEPPPFPRWVRWLAMLHVLSLFLGPLGFFVLIIIASILGMRRGPYDATVLMLGASALACPALAALYRSLFERWARARWPAPPEIEDEPSV